MVHTTNKLIWCGSGLFLGKAKVGLVIVTAVGAQSVYYGQMLGFEDHRCTFLLPTRREAMDALETLIVERFARYDIEIVKTDGKDRGY